MVPLLLKFVSIARAAGLRISTSEVLDSLNQLELVDPLDEPQFVAVLQANFAKSRGWRDGFAVANVRQQFTRAPIAFLIGLVATLALALPLYALKAELLPREAAWLPSIVFVLSIWPARLLVGWAIYRADRRDSPRHGVFRWGSWLAIVPVVLFYSLVVYLTQYLSWYGVWSLYEQHAYLLPVPFVGL